MKMNNKRKQTALDFDQKIVISMKLKRTKAGSSWGGLQSVETNSKLDMTWYNIITPWGFAASWRNNDDDDVDDDWHCISSVRS